MVKGLSDKKPANPENPYKDAKIMEEDSTPLDETLIEKGYNWSLFLTSIFLP